jgi:acetyl-CoA carboxylase biotin carboxyl carrier protein
MVVVNGGRSNVKTNLTNHQSPSRITKKGEIFMATPVTVPMVGKIVSVSVKVGDKVKEDDQVAVLEAMKMEMPLVAPVSGVVKEVCVSAGQEVEAEATIVMIE